MPALCLSLLAAAPARAAEPATATPTPSSPADDFLIWKAPVGCSTAAAVRERVSELLGEPQLDLRQVERVEGRVSEAASGWTLQLTLVDALGRRERTLSSESCQDLAEAAAVAITLAFEAARSRQAQQPSEAEPEAPEPAPSDTPPAGPEPEASPSDARAASAHAALAAELLADVNTLPALAPGVSLSAGIDWSELRLSAFVSWLPGADKALRPGQGVTFSLLGGGVRGCYTLGHGVVDTRVCAGIELGRLSARGAGLVDARSVADLWLAPLAGLELGVPLLDELGLYTRADAVIPLLRQSYAVNQTEDVHELASVGVRGALGLWLRF